MTGQKMRLTVLGAIGAVAGFGVGMFSEWVNEKKLDMKLDAIISEKVQEELQKQATKMNKC